MSRWGTGSTEDGLGPRRAHWVFTGRRDGVSRPPWDGANLADHVGDASRDVAANRARLARSLGLPDDRLAIMHAAHGRRAAVVDGPGIVPDVDILVSRQPALGLVALAADCATIALADPRAGVISAVHSGWRGVAVDAPGAAVEAMVELGADPERIVAALGPAICAGCYEVSDDVRSEVADQVGTAAAVTTQGTPAVDLHAGARSELERVGLHQVTADSRCTFELQDDLFSFRRDGRTGRHGVGIVLWGAADE